ncbi:hypothetical protein V1520DRAFT_73632 [Lipomyces starkeyi]|uniref:Uncharacterized protein n=1 Tax=Lipomyces starkeyi NRRL Y-11557 TaxID=675824 RepID=A0A1E3PWT9_LIPST|nr:hypothetical protein LIPSTDRAFT_75419 [Lipomyces starkeyi NRRL Y-11557]
MSAETNAIPLMEEAVQPPIGIDISIDDPELLQEDSGLMEIDQNSDANVSATEQAAQYEPTDTVFLRLEAVLLHGVDQMSTDDVKSYASHYFPQITPNIEWIDDSSVLFVFDSEDAAKQALEAFTSEAEYYDQPPEGTALRNAKVHPLNGKYALKVRVALQSDRKTKWSRERSKYYLFHGDPREQLYEKRRQETRSRRPRRRSASPEKPVHMDLVEFSRGRRRQNDEDDFPSVLKDTRRRQNDDDFPSVLKDTHAPISKSWAKAGSIDRYVPSARDSGPSSRRIDRHGPRDTPRRRSLSPDRYQAGSGDRARDGGFPRRIGGDISSRSLAVRLGAKGGNDDDHASDFASRLSVKEDDDKNGGRRRKRAHHLEFD